MAGKELEMKGRAKETPAAPVVVVIVPPDGGYGWVITLAAFLCNCVVDGIIFSFGLVIADLALSFSEPVSKVAWVGSLLSGFYLLAGPFVSALANRFGFRAVAILGSVIGCVALAVSMFAQSVLVLYVTVGVVGGIGFGLVYVPAVIAVGFYFEKKRALATGIAVCGSGVGTFVFAPLTSFLLEQYGWKGTLLIHAGLILNCAVFGSLFRPLEPTTRPADPEGSPLMTVMAGGKSTAAGGHQSSTQSLNVVTVRAREIGEGRGSPAPSRKSVTSSNQSLNRTARPLDRMDAFYTGSVHSLAQYKQDPVNYHASVTKIAADEDKQESMLDSSLFRSPSFVLICLSAFLTFMGFFVPFMFLAARAIQNGVDKDSASRLLSIIGITNTIGRVICGWVADHPKVNVLLLNNISLTVCGAVTILSPLFQSYEMLIVYSCLFGISIAGIASLRSILLVELLGLENLTNAFGLMLPFTGVSAAIGGPLAGMFYDATQDYDASFYLSGSMLFVSGLLCYPLGCINRWEKANKAKQIRPVAEPNALRL